MYLFRIIPLLACVLQAACGFMGPDLPQAPRAPPPTQSSTPPPHYRVQVGDLLSVRLYLTPELDEDVTVRPDGRISTTLAETIPAAGFTTEQVAESLRIPYSHELRDPRLTVEVKAPAPTRIYVAGEVPSPGEFITTGPPLTLLQAISRAGGLRPTGAPGGIVIVRHGPDSKPIVLATLYQRAITGADPGADVTLEPFDIVYVPRSEISKIYVWVNQHIQQFVPVSWGFSYNVNPVVSSFKQQ